MKKYVVKCAKCSVKVELKDTDFNDSTGRSSTTGWNYTCPGGHAGFVQEDHFNKVNEVAK